VGQEQHECSDPPPRQPLETDGLLHNQNLATGRRFRLQDVSTTATVTRELSVRIGCSLDICSNNIHRGRGMLQDRGHENLGCSPTTAFVVLASIPSSSASGICSSAGTAFGLAS
jgi:hypothetical protein